MDGEPSGLGAEGEPPVDAGGQPGELPQDAFQSSWNALHLMLDRDCPACRAGWAEYVDASMRLGRHVGEAHPDRLAYVGLMRPDFAAAARGAADVSTEL